MPRPRGKQIGPPREMQKKYAARSRSFPRDSVPDAEIVAFEAELRANAGLFGRGTMYAYESCGLEVLPDARGAEISERILRAIATRRPLSVIRLGDSEMNIMSFGAFHETPALDRHVVEAVVRDYDSTFRMSPPWFPVLREMMVSAVATADIVGVLGLSPLAPEHHEPMIERFARTPRGIHGHLRARQFLPRYASMGFLDGKLIASAHLYFGIVLNLDRLIAAAENVLLVTSRPGLRDAIALRHPGRPISVIDTVFPEAEEELDAPLFLARMDAALPADLSGCLCLLGAGVWTEFYCSWIRQRGGIAVDIGSGFDLLDGAVTRPVHRNMSEAERQRFRLGGLDEDDCRPALARPAD